MRKGVKMPAKGDGISKRRDGRYMARYTVETPEGPKRKTIYGRKYKEVEKKLSEARGDAARGLVFDADNLKLGEYLDRWLTDSVVDTVRPTTFERYEQIVRVHIRPSLGKLKLKNVTPAHVRSLYREKLEVGLSPRTVQYIHVTLHKALKQAVADGLIPRNATEAVRPPQVRKEEIRPLTAEQVKILFGAVRDDRLEALYILAVHTGLRQGELLGLKWGDVDLGAGMLQVRRSLTTAKGGPVLRAPKTKGSRRTVKLSPTALEALRSHLERQLGEIDQAGDLWRENGLIFASDSGEPLKRHYITTHRFKPLLKRVGLPQIRFHDLRHTCATLLLTKNVNPKVVSEMLGHATIAITLDTYSHVLPNMQSEAAQAMEEALT
jgi:integrase